MWSIQSAGNYQRYGSNLIKRPAADYDEDAGTVEAVVIRVGQVAGVVGADDTIPEIKDEPTDPNYNFTEE